MSAEGLDSIIIVNYTGMYNKCEGTVGARSGPVLVWFGQQGSRHRIDRFGRSAMTQRPDAKGPKGGCRGPLAGRRTWSQAGPVTGAIDIGGGAR